MRGRDLPCLMVFCGLLLVLSPTACRRDSSPTSPPASRPSGRSAPPTGRRGVTSVVRPLRIVSHSPALTEILQHMGLSRYVVGIGRFCKWKGPNKPPVVCDLFKINVEATLAARPTLIVTQSSRLSIFQPILQINPKIRLLAVKLRGLHDIPRAIEQIGQVTGYPNKARALQHDFWKVLKRVQRQVRGRQRVRALFVVGYKRPLVAARGSFVDDLFGYVRGTNVGRQVPGKHRWRNTAIEGILQLRPEAIICRVQPGKEAAARAFWKTLTDLPAVQQKKVFVVSDPLWLLPSVRFVRFAPLLARMLHGDLPRPRPVNKSPGGLPLSKPVNKSPE